VNSYTYMCQKLRSPIASRFIRLLFSVLFDTGVIDTAYLIIL